MDETVGDISQFWHNMIPAQITPNNQIDFHNEGDWKPYYPFSTGSLHLPCIVSSPLNEAPWGNFLCQ